jgi:hypothetical protein
VKGRFNGVNNNIVITAIPNNEIAKKNRFVENLNSSFDARDAT